MTRGQGRLAGSSQVRPLEERLTLSWCLADVRRPWGIVLNCGLSVMVRVLSLSNLARLPGARLSRWAMELSLRLVRPLAHSGINPATSRPLTSADAGAASVPGSWCSAGPVRDSTGRAARRDSARTVINGCQRYPGRPGQGQHPRTRRPR